LDDKEKEIRDAKFRYSIVEGKVKKQNTELQKQKDIIKEQEKEISEIKDKLEKGKVETYNLELFYKSEICTKILRNIYGNNIKPDISCRIQPAWAGCALVCIGLCCGACCRVLVVQTTDVCK
jgi:hypothetical protein